MTEGEVDGLFHLLGDNKRSQFGDAGKNSVVAREVLPLRGHQSGDALEEAEPVEKSTEEADRAFRNQLLKQKTPGIKLELTRGMPPFCRSPSYETIETNI